MKQAVASVQLIDLRSDHLKAVFAYALEQAHDSGINVLDFGDNENALDSDEQYEYIKESLEKLELLTADGNKDLLIVKPSQEAIDMYQASLVISS